MRRDLPWSPSRCLNRTLPMIAIGLMLLAGCAGSAGMGGGQTAPAGEPFTYAPIRVSSPGLEASADLGLMPVPERLERTVDRFDLGTHLRFSVEGVRDERVVKAAARTRSRLAWKTGIPYDGLPEPAAGPVIRFRTAGPGLPVQSVEEDESYQLIVGSDEVRLEAPGPVGILRGMETLLQLVRMDEAGWYLPGVRIADAPRFRWRGVLIDVCRHWIPPDVLKRNLDGLAAVKMNVLHWHLTEDQGFRIESKAFPGLQEQGSDGHYYTQAQVREIVAYARDRGIRVVPEFDVPGHTSSWLVSHPELAAAPGPYEIGRRWGVFDAALNPADERVYDFLDTFFGEMAGLFPDAYLHIGGDEVTGRQWDASEQVQAFMAEHGLADNHALQTYFNQRISGILQKHGKKMVGWDEILHPDLPRDTVVQSWRGPASLAGAVRQGNLGILSSGWYLDHMLSAAQHYAVDPIPEESDLTADERARILGGEACMWAEFVTWETEDSRIWPRNAAVAERLWSPREVRDPDSMYDRMAGVSRDLDYFGLTHRTSFTHMIERLAGADGDAISLALLASYLEPLKYYGRSGSHPYSSLDPLNRLVDAVRPESEAARLFTGEVDAFLADSPSHEAGWGALVGRLDALSGNHERLRRTLVARALLTEILPVSRRTSQIARTGRQAVDFIRSGRPAPPDWKAAAEVLLGAPEEAELIIMIAPAVRRLVEAVPEAMVELDSGWYFHQGITPGPGEAGDAWRPATVPGSVHTDLMADGVIEDPFWRANEKDVQWVGYRDWIYRTRFQVPEALAGMPHLDLVFDGLDTYAEVFLNGKTVLDTDNMFRTWRVPDTALRNGRGIGPGGTQELMVAFRSPIEEVLPVMSQVPYQLPASNDAGEKTSPYTRKAPYQFGWDWGPRLVTSGIWKPVRLVAWEGARIPDLQIVTDTLDPDSAHLTVRVTVSAPGGLSGAVRVTSPEGAFEAVLQPVELEAGTHTVDVPVVVASPRLWWPNGLGDQPLYHFRADVEDASGRLLNSALERTGLRTLELRQEPDEWGTSFAFVVNGVPVFAKGGNWIPADSFPHRVDRARYEQLLGSCRDANMNMLRVWGGGIYEADDFYDLCDEYGLLVWQDFMFSCSMYPGDEAFLANVREEATQQVRRLRDHPSMALWCGNNESETAWFTWGWRRENPESVWEDYRTLFHGLLPEVVAAEDPGRSYWPSSPSSDLAAAANDPTIGDNHYWDVWHGRQPFSAYAEQAPRFMSEYGFQSFPLLPTVETFTEPGDRRMGSEVMDAHQKNPAGNELIRVYMEREYPEPVDFPSFLYVSQVQQAEGIKIAAEHLRFEMPKTMGSLYWQINDCWPVASWSGMDYYGTWKALHYYARRFYAPVLVGVEAAGDELLVRVVSDLTESIPAVLEVELHDFDGSLIRKLDSAVEVTPVSSLVAVRLDRGKWAAAGDPKRTYLEVRLSRTGDARGPRLLSENRWYPAAVKDVVLPDPRISAEVQPMRGGVRVRLTAEAIARAVHLSVEGAPGRFSDDFFDLAPGRPVTVVFRPGEGADLAGFADRLRITSLYEAFGGSGR